jgi:DNA-binding GntR family transcriptional regulator
MSQPKTAPKPPKPERGPSLTEQAYAILRRRLITCQLRPGAEFSELDLAEELAMSKTPVREALTRLALEGYVDAFPRRGYRVRSITFKDVNDVFDVRLLLEPAAASLAAARLTSAQIDAIEQIAYHPVPGHPTPGHPTPGKAPDREAIVAANRDYHAAIAQASGNPRLAALVIAHLEESERFLYLGGPDRDVNVETTHDHAALLDAFRRKDPPAASRIMASHIEHTRTSVTANILNSQFVEIGI